MRQELDDRRPAFAFNIQDANGTTYRLTTSFDGGKVKEVWINGGGKVGTERHDTLTEMGRIIWVALQHGVPLEELRSCATYHSDRRPATIIGEVLDALDFEN